MTTPNVEAPEWAAAQATPWTTVNQGLRIFDAFAARAMIEDRDRTSPPATCADGARYLVKATASGAWLGHDGELAIAVGANAANGWYFATVAIEGMELYVRDEDIRIRHDGSDWEDFDLIEITTEATVSRPLTRADHKSHIRCTAATLTVIALPLDYDEDLPDGFTCSVTQAGDGTVIIEGDVGVTINYPLDYELAVGGLYHVVQILKVGNDEYDVFGGLLYTGGS